jgi:hypothetical protein
MPIAHHVSSASNVPQHTSIQGFRSTLNPTARIISGYRISRVPTPCSVDSSNVQVNEIPIACHVSYDSNGQDCYRDFTYREFEGLENLFPLDFLICETLKRNLCRALTVFHVSFLDQRSSCFRDFLSPLHLVLKDHAPSSGSDDGRSSHSDLTPEICSPLLCTPPVLIQI